MTKKSNVIKFLLLLLLGGGIIFFANNLFSKKTLQIQQQQRNYIVVQVFGAVEFLEPLIFPKKMKVYDIIKTFDLKQNANLQIVYYRKHFNFLLTKINFQASPK